MRTLRDTQRRARRASKKGPREVSSRMPALPEGYHVGCQKRIVWAPAAEAGDALAFWYHTYALREHEGERGHIRSCITTAEESPERNNALPALIRLLRERGLRSACSYIRRAAGLSFMSRFLVLTKPHLAETEEARASYAEYLRKECRGKRRERRRIQRQRKLELEKEAAELAELEKQRREEESKEETAATESRPAVTQRKKEVQHEESGIYDGSEPTTRKVVTTTGGILELQVHDGGKSLAQRIEEDGFLNRRSP